MYLLQISYRHYVCEGSPSEAGNLLDALCNMVQIEDHTLVSKLSRCMPLIEITIPEAQGNKLSMLRQYAEAMEEGEVA